VRDVVEITGLEALRQRFAALAAAKDLGPTLRAEAGRPFCLAARQF